MQRRYRWPALAALILVVTGPFAAHAQSYADGYAAFNAGNYQSARAIWQDLTDRGDTLSMIALGTLFERGFGVPQNLPRALQLYQQAQSMGDGRAAPYIQRVQATAPAMTPQMTTAQASSRRSTSPATTVDRPSRMAQSGLQAVRGPYVSISAGPSFPGGDEGQGSFDTGVALDAMGGWDFGMVRLQGGLIFRRTSTEIGDLSSTANAVGGLASAHWDLAIAPTVELSPFAGVGGARREVELEPGPQATDGSMIWAMGVDLNWALSAANLSLGYAYTALGEDFYNSHDVRVGTRFYF